MIAVQRGPSSTIEDGAFHIRRMRPGMGSPNSPSGALGPLSVVDHAIVGSGTTIAMDEHKDDEILSYIDSGHLVHEDTSGNRITLSANRLMMMNAGAGLSHEESAPTGAVEMLQIFVRPAKSALPGLVTFFERPQGRQANVWNLIAGPAECLAPLTFRNDVTVFDAQLAAGARLGVPRQAGKTTWVYVFRGAVRAHAIVLEKGDAFAVPSPTIQEIEALEPTLLVAFVTNPAAPGVRTGSISGRD